MADSKNYWGKNYYKNPNLSTSSKSSSSAKSTAKKAATSAANKGLNNAISNTLSNSGLSSSQSKAVSKEVKKLSVKSKICIVLLFIIGVVLSIGTCYFVCRNDKFEIVGKKTITLSIGDSYTDAGAEAVAFSKNISATIEIQVLKDGTPVNMLPSELDTSEECTYQIFYKLNNFRFRNVSIARTITIINPEIVEPEEGAY